MSHVLSPENQVVHAHGVAGRRNDALRPWEREMADDRERRPTVLRTVFEGILAIGEVILVALAVPLAILAIGLPVVLLVRLVLGIARAL